MPHDLRLTSLPLFIAMLFAVPALPVTAKVDLSTVAERSGFLKTGRYDEVITLCDAFQQAYPEAIQCQTFGTTPEGRAMKVLVASNRTGITPAKARAAGLPVVLIQGGIHAGEIDGKDAGFLALREVLEKKVATESLDKLVVLFVPVFNVDGHERFGRWNRPNQRGPEEMGWRTTAQNLNLNRDYAKAQSPEMKAMLALIEAWDPIITADLHATNGAQFEHDISITMEPVNAGDTALQPLGRAIRDQIIDLLASQGSLPIAFYPSFERQDDPRSGFVDSVSPPRFSSGYFPLRNRFTVLVETHSWRTYPERVASTRNTIINLLTLATAQGKTWLSAAAAADQRAMSLGGKSVPLTYAATDASRIIAFRGYAYTRSPSEISGALMTRYDETRPQIWNIPLRDVVKPLLSVTAPTGGYWVPAAHAMRVGEVLKNHGIAFQHLTEALPPQPLQAFHAVKAHLDAVSVEGNQRLSVEGEWDVKNHALPAGSLFVPIAQPKARLLMALLEPQAPDSLLAWGLFNTAFEPKEYLENYVAEQVAREMLKADPALREAFHRQLAEDAAFAASPAQRLKFFYSRHSAWDERLNLYPILRSNTLASSPVMR